MNYRLSGWRVWMLIHWQFSIMLPITSSAFAFFYTSVIPFRQFLSIQKQEFFYYRAACFWTALAPTEIKLGLGLFCNSSSESGLLRRLNMWLRSSLSGRSTVCCEPMVILTPRHVRNPFGSNKHKNSQISFCKARGLLFDSLMLLISLKMSHM